MINSHIQNGHITIDESALSALPKAQVIKGVTDAIIRGEIVFPFKKYFMGDPKIMFERLQQYHPITSTSPYSIPNIRMHKAFTPTFRRGYLTIISSDTDYDRMDIICDYYQEKARLTAQRSDSQSNPLDCWKDRQCVTAIVEVALTYGCITTYTLREAVYKVGKEATQFKPTLLIGTIRVLFKDPKGVRMLDISAGWGDRLVGAMAAGIDKYVAYDPNTSLKAGHDAMINAFAQKNAYEIRYKPFEVHDPELDGATFNLVFTSPPFWDFERYTSLPGQSIDTFKTFETWATKFLFASLHKASGHLVMGGYMVIHITDVYKTKIVEPMLLFMDGYVSNMKFIGVISSLAEGGAQKHRPMWVWVKEIKQPNKSAVMSMAKLFPAISRHLA